ncbi:hypothetical protein DTO217A2_6665 [Paecilomyces variotii]|nr:hypothetical protein DTO217A2_6665 [Paecilomyces variotii]KAJ9367153.1 hypothetical protein DTO282E5_8196 [Paecilomyces variotii]
MSPHLENNSSVAERDKWLGQEIFRFSLAKEFVQYLPAKVPSNEYDNLFAKCLECYQYRSACEDPDICGESFPSGYRAEQKEYQDILFRHIGSIGLTEPDALARLHKYIPFAHDWKASESDQGSVGKVPSRPVERTLTQLPTTRRLWGGSGQDMTDSRDRQLDGIARYTSLLYEQGQMLCAMPEYEEQGEFSSTGLPWFSATVRFRGVEGHGSGPNKKIARHAASKDACDKLGIS